MEIIKDLIKVRNFEKGRDGQKVLAIVIHVMEGTWEGTDSWFDNDESNVSAHYGVAKDGRVKQWVLDEDQAWHAGIKKNPTSALVREMGAINTNSYTIGIEFEGTATSLATEFQFQSGGKLIAELCRKHRIPLATYPDYLIPHRAIRSDKTCPGKISVAELYTRALEELRRPDLSLEQRVEVIEEALRSARIL